MKNIKIQDESGDKKYFTIIPNYILNHSTLWDREVYIQMKRITGESGTCWASQKTLAKQCGISINRLKKSIKYLIENKWIKHIGLKIVETKGGPQEINEYSVSDLWKLNTNFYEAKGVSRKNTPIIKGVSPKEQRGITSEAKGVSPDDDKEELREEEPIKKIATQRVADNLNPIIELFKEVNPSYEKIFKNTTQRSALKRLVDKWGEEKIKSAIETLSKTNGMKYAPTITTPLQLEDKLGSLIAFIKKERSSGKNVIGIAI